MVMEVEQSGDTYSANGELYEQHLYYDGRTAENHVYGLGEGEYGVLVTFGSAEARMLADGALTLLDKIGVFPAKVEGVELSGVIPD